MMKRSKSFRRASGTESPIDWRHRLPNYGPKQLSRNVMKEDTKECSGGLSAKGGRNSKRTCCKAPSLGNVSLCGSPHVD